MGFEIFDIIPFAQAASLAFMAILFIQSGLDKVFDYQGNKQWLSNHFGKSPLRNTVPVLLPVITLLELSAGICSAIGLILFISLGTTGLGVIGIQLACISLLALFFGQRVAKDYAGAATLVPYFILALFSLYLLNL